MAEEECRDAGAELDAAIEKVLASGSARKLVVAGPGAGKTTLFRKVLESMGNGAHHCLAVTFINNLKDDLERDLGDLAEVSTLHSYSLGLLHKYPALRDGLTTDFRCCPGLAHIIKADWGFIEESEAPRFLDEMRNLVDENHLPFYLSRGKYYDAVDFDDMVWRAHVGIDAGEAALDTYDLVLIDEYQDFNRLEAAFIDHLGSRSPILIAGDDDQALYSRLRSSSCEYIRLLYGDEEYEVFELPFCLRCPEVIVAAVDDVICSAQRLGKLQGRIPKPYRYFPPAKGADSALYPTIHLVKTSVQREGGANYMGRYLEAAIKSIPPDDVREAKDKGYPAALVIASDPYKRQIVQHLEGIFAVDTKRDDHERLSRSQGLEILKGDRESNLGWRIVLEVDRPAFLKSVIRESAEKGVSLVDVLPPEYRESVADEAEQHQPADSGVGDGQGEAAEDKLEVKVSSYEGAKGLSAQHVYIVGLHDGDIPRHPDDIQDIEICRFIVGLTRTRKSCTLIHTARFAGQQKSLSSLVRWIDAGRFTEVWVNRDFWSQYE